MFGLFIALAPQPAFAWGDEGHEIIALVAERFLDPGVREKIAAMLDVRLTTVRWHLASLFRKTGTSRQAELVRALLSLRRL